MQRYRKPAPRPPVQKRPVENPRMTALNVLQDVAHEDAYASLALGKRLRASKLPQRDRDLVTELVYGTLERQITIDYFLNKYLERPDVESVARDILRLGAYQILFLTRIPDSAAVDESVKMTRLINRDTFAGLINGVLRNLARSKDDLPWPEKDADPALYLSVRHSMPKWIVQRLLDAYGYEETEAIASFQPDERHMTLRLTADRVTPAEFEAQMTQKGWTWSHGRLPGTYYASGIGDVGIDKEYLKGIYTVQGESSILAALAVTPKRGGIVLDACAAPGGKTACLATAMQGTGRVYAWDVHEHRVELIRNMTRRLHLDSVRPAVRDATIVKEDLAGTVDAVLLDAPCSGLGVMLSKPDVKLRQTPESVESLVALQAQLLDACCQYVKRGGTLVYSTCTILPEENSRQVEAFLARHPEFEPDEAGLRAAMPDFVQDAIDGCMLQLQAHRDGAEGFFIARMKRKKA